MTVESFENDLRETMKYGLDHYRIPTTQYFPEQCEKLQDFTAGKVLETG